MQADSSGAVRALVENTNSLRGALFSVKAGIEALDNSHIGFEFVLGERRHIRGDLISETTLPADFGALYHDSGGAGFDPILDAPVRDVDLTHLNVEELVQSGPMRFARSPFLNALIEIGCTRLASYQLPKHETSGRVIFTVMYHHDCQFDPSRKTLFQSLNREILAAVRECGHFTRHFGLSEREVTVIRQVANGANANEIALALSVTSRTVENRLKSAREKLRARTSAEAIYKATAFGLI